MDRVRFWVEAVMINPVLSDAAVEDWFARHGVEADSVAHAVFLAIAPWIPIIGVPANDRLDCRRR